MSFLIEKYFHGNIFLFDQVVHVEIENSPTHIVIVTVEDIPESAEGFPLLQPRSFATQGLQIFLGCFFVVGV